MMRKLDDRALDEVARFFSALGVTMRLRILNLLRDGEKNVGDITGRTGCTQANVSKHLAVLTRNGLVQKTARGTSAYYRIADPAVYGLCDMVCGQIGKQMAGQESLRRMFAAAAKPPAPRAARRRKSRAEAV